MKKLADYALDLCLAMWLGALVAGFVSSLTKAL
jgi:hypothetical protein